MTPTRSRFCHRLILYSTEGHYHDTGLSVKVGNALRVGLYVPLTLEIHLEAEHKGNLGLEACRGLFLLPCRFVFLI